MAHSRKSNNRVDLKSLVVERKTVLHEGANLARRVRMERTISTGRDDTGESSIRSTTGDVLEPILYAEAVDAPSTLSQSADT